jgi:hypothetical protein
LRRSWGLGVRFGKNLKIKEKNIYYKSNLIFKLKNMYFWNIDKLTDDLKE